MPVTHEFTSDQVDAAIDFVREHAED